MRPPLQSSMQLGWLPLGSVEFGKAELAVVIEIHEVEGGLGAIDRAGWGAWGRTPPTEPSLRSAVTNAG